MLKPLSTCNKVTRVCAAIYLTSFCYLLLQENSGSSVLPSVAIIIMNNWVVSIRAQCPYVWLDCGWCTCMHVHRWWPSADQKFPIINRASGACSSSRLDQFARGKGAKVVVNAKTQRKDPKTIRKGKYRNTHGKDLIRYQQISSYIKETNQWNHGHPNDVKGQLASW